MLQSVGMYTVHVDFARFAPKLYVQSALINVFFVIIVLCHIHLHVHFWHQIISSVGTCWQNWCTLPLSECLLGCYNCQSCVCSLSLSLSCPQVCPIADFLQYQSSKVNISVDKLNPFRKEVGKNVLQFHRNFRFVPPPPPFQYVRSATEQKCWERKKKDSWCKDILET